MDFMKNSKKIEYDVYNKHNETIPFIAYLVW